MVSDDTPTIEWLIQNSTRNVFWGTVHPRCMSGILKSTISRAKCRYVQEYSLMLRWVVGTFHHGGTIDCFSLQAALNDFSNKDSGECYNVCRIGHIKEPLLLIKKYVHVVMTVGFLFDCPNSSLL